MYDNSEIINRTSVLTIAHVQTQETLCVLALRVKSNWTFEEADESVLSTLLRRGQPKNKSSFPFARTIRGGRETLSLELSR